jgi:enamine deaminase RidA (YjgF/YER057c/UK114 family)
MNASVRAAASEPRRVLDELDELLTALGSSKSNLLTARVLLSDTSLLGHYDSAWTDWLERLRRPLRVFRFTGRQEPLIDITVTAIK